MDRRNFPRHPARGDAPVQLGDENAQVADISQSGTRLLLDKAVPTDSMLTLKGEGAKLAARVLQCDYAPQGWEGTGHPYQVRCQFEEPTFEEQLLGFGAEIEQLAELIQPS